MVGLPQTEGNYGGCLAEVALEFGVPRGRVDGLYERLEGVTKVCVAISLETNLCLLSPAVSAVGVTALTPTGMNVLRAEISAAFHEVFPAHIDEYPIWPNERHACTYKHYASKAKVFAGDGPQARHGITGEQTINVAHILAAYGNPTPPIAAELVGTQLDASSGLLKRLESLGGAVVSSLDISDDASPKKICVGPATVDVWVGDDKVTISERIGGFVVHERPPQQCADRSYASVSEIPANAIVVAWPRRREVHIPLSKSLVKQLALR